jgi:hypothetical protein
MLCILCLTSVFDERPITKEREREMKKIKYMVGERVKDKIRGRK